MVSLTKWLLFAALAIASLHTSFGIKIDVGNSFFNEVQRSKRATQKATFSKGGEDYCNCECAAGCTPECPVCPKPCATCGGGGYEPPVPPPEPKTTEPTTTTEPPTTTTPEPTTTTEPPTTTTPTEPPTEPETYEPPDDGGYGCPTCEPPPCMTTPPPIDGFCPVCG